MRRISVKTVNAVLLIPLLLMISLVYGAGSFFIPKVSAAELVNRSLELSDSSAGKQAVTYNVSFQIATQGTLGSIELEFCSNSTFPTDPCVAPIGLDTSKAVFSLETGISGFTIFSQSANDIVVSRPPAPILAVPATLRFDNVTNPSNSGSYYLRVLTYASNDATGPTTDTGGMAFAINPTVSVRVQVPPYILFCTGNTISGTDCSTASGDFIDLGALTPTRTSSGESQMVIATNAQNGYNISTSGGTLTSGNNIIPALSTSSPSQVGVSQFGINLRANTNPAIGSDPSGPGGGTPTTNYNQPNLYMYNNGDVIVTNAGVEDYRKYTVSYIVNISKAQSAGVYASTFTYVALGNF